MEGAGQVDVFISHTGCDWGWASWLDFVLRDAGYTTKVQGYDFAVGRSFVHAMDEALKQCRLVVCLLSPSYLASRWCSEEWEAGLYKDKLFLLRIADCNPDGLLGPRAYLDLVGVPENHARDQLLAGFQKRDGQDARPTTKPTFPGKVSASSARPRFPGSLPPIWNITEERNAFFTGRDEMLEQLHQALTEGETAALTQAVVGLGGVGKTQLAVEYACRYGGEYDGIWWLHAEEAATLSRDYAKIAPKLGIAEVADQGQMIREARYALSRQERILLLFDNATEPNVIKPYMPLGDGRQVIVTTRAKAWPNATEQEITELRMDAAVSFLFKRTGQNDENAAQDIAQRLGCLPLALEHAGAYVQTCGKSLQDYALLLAKHGLDALEEGKAHQYEKTVGTTWELAFDEAQRRCPAAKDLLNICSFLTRCQCTHQAPRRETELMRRMRTPVALVVVGSRLRTALVRCTYRGTK